MRFTAIILLSACLQVSAKGYSQITLSETNAPLKKVFKQIQKQSGYDFLFSSDLVQQAGNVTIRLQNATLQQAVEECLKGKLLDFEIQEKTVIIKKKIALPPALNIPPAVDDERVANTIQGRITDSLGQPMAGVSILVKGTNIGTTTNADGRYSVAVPNENSILVFSYLGFISREVVVGSRTSIDLRLTAENKLMTDIVVTGYSKQSKRDVTGAVTVIGADIVQHTPVTDVGSILQGRAAGVTVDDQGGPGNTAVVRIRGFGSIANNNPLYVVDGIQMQDANNLINPNDIETITVLKDPSITSIYGAQGGNGVIVITTKTGKMGAPKLEYSGLASWESSIKIPKTINPQQYANAYWGYLENSGLSQSNAYYGNGTTPVLPYYVVERKTGGALALPQNSPLADPSLYNLNTYRILQMNQTGTDWWSAMLGTAFTTNQQLSLSGATDKSNYALSFNYFDNKGVMLGTYFRRYSLRVNTEFTPKPWLKVGENIQFAYSQGNNVNQQNHTSNSIMGDLYNRSPLMPMFDIAGNYSGPNGIPDTYAFHPGGNNPVMSQNNSLANNHGYSAGVFGTAFIDVEPIKNLIFESKIGIQFYPSSYSYFNDTFPQNVYTAPYNSFTEGSSWSSDWRWTNKVSYSVQINNIHKINAFVAYEADSYQYRASSGTTPNLPYTFPAYLNLGNGVPIDTTGGVFNSVTGGTDASTTLSIFGNINYSLMDKYLFSFVIRRDGSSKFGPEKKYGTFPSYSAGWRISKESFMDRLTWVDDLKIRAAFGTNGNNAINSGAYLNQYNTDPYTSRYDLGGNNTSASTGVALYWIGNPYVHWETNQTTNIGFDATLFKNHLTMSFSWFNRATKDLLAPVPISGLEGDALAPYQNVMNFTNKGVELELGYNNTIGKLRYEINFNIATYKNNVDHIVSDSSVYIDGAAYPPTHFALTRSAVGHPVSSFYGLVQTGIFQSGEEYTKYGVTEPGLNAGNAAGHFKFKDISGPEGKPDGKIDNFDRTYIGSPHPNFTYGFNLNLFYNNFDVQIFLQGVSGNKLFNYWRAYSVWPGAQGEGSTDTWTTANTGAKLPIWNSNATNDANPSSFFVEDGSYMRLKSLQIGYTFHKTKAFSSLRIYVQGFNLLTTTKYSGIDPEISTGSATSAGVDYGGNYPITKKFLVGVNLGL